MKTYNVMESETPIEVFFCDDTAIADATLPYPELPAEEHEAFQKTLDEIMDSRGL